MGEFKVNYLRESLRLVFMGEFKVSIYGRV